jgi:catechol 2,3-dioxygenase-like lactoylglutathione lyase family enzyme
MTTARVTGVRSVALAVPELPARVGFYSNVWHLAAVAERDKAVYLRGTGAYHHILALHARPDAALLSIDFAAPDDEAVTALHGGLARAGLAELAPPAPLSEPGGGFGFTCRDPDGRLLRIIAGDARHGDAAARPDRPSKITHIVLNAPDPAAISDFYCRHLGFRVIDRTRYLTFLCCNADHHAIAFAQGEAPTLHHIAFEMPEIDSLMRGAGRMRDAGFALDWGVGRHGPGNNVFAYFVGPDDVVLEYTAEVEQVDASYRVRGPEDWTWPPGRTDQWGIALGPTPRLALAQKRIRFAPGRARPAS